MGQYGLGAADVSETEFTGEQTGRDGNFRPECEAWDVTETALVRGPSPATTSSPMRGRTCPTGPRQDLSLLRDEWRVRGPEDRSLLATVASDGAPVALAETLRPLSEWIGHVFTLSDAAGEEVGVIESGFGVFDAYEIPLSDASVPGAPIVLGAAVIDAVQGN